MGNCLLDSMTASMDSYIGNSTDIQLWDEIQTEQNCCGVMSYKDWTKSGYGNGTDVPDSCCLLIEDGCGRGVANEKNPGNDIVTDGCLSTILNAMVRDVSELARNVWMPVVGIHAVLLLLLIIADRLHG
ncbi:unnamed protein product, partial [Meganyctiphanes norvegica]